MKKKWTRRKFLKTGLRSSIALGGAAVTVFPTKTDKAEQLHELSSQFNSRDRKLLSAAMDEIIPAADGMPAASEVGGVKYLEQIIHANADIKKGLARSLEALQSLSQELFDQGFCSLSREQRVQALAEMDRVKPDSFSILRDAVYEAYYTQPQVWKLIGYEFHATDENGPHMKPFDGAVLDKVRKMPKLYREAT